jgi:hypothetical protein
MIVRIAFFAVLPMFVGLQMRDLLSRDPKTKKHVAAADEVSKG